MEKQNLVLVLLALLIGASFGGWATMAFAEPDTVIKEVEVEVPVIQTVEVPGPTVEVEVSVPTDSFWTDLAWTQILDEFESEDRFYTCDGHEFDDDELSITLDESDVGIAKNGDVTVTGTWEFEFEDSSDERDCKVDNSFEVFWDEDDVEDADWNEAEVSLA